MITSSGGISGTGLLLSLLGHTGLALLGLVLMPREEPRKSVTPVMVYDVMLVSDFHTENPRAGTPDGAIDGDDAKVQIPAPAVQEEAVKKRSSELALTKKPPTITPLNPKLDIKEKVEEQTADVSDADAGEGTLANSIESDIKSAGSSSSNRRGILGVPGGTGNEFGTNYEQLVGNWLAKHKQYPERARRRGMSGEAVLRLVLDRSGAVQEYTVLQGTAHAILNEEVKRMVTRAQPFPPAPQNYPAEKVQFLIPISFRLQ